MSRATPIQTSFNAGELTPRLHGRVDQQLYRDGCATMLGWLPTVQGAAVAAPGTIHVDACKGPCRFVAFEYDTTQGYVLEFSDHALRFYTNDVLLRTSYPDGAPVEIATPWTYADVLALDYQQSADVMYLVHPSGPGKLLRRLGAATFDLVDLVAKDGPFEDGNADDTITVSASGTQGDVTLTASAPLFEAGDVGGLFSIEAGDFAAIRMWEPGITVAVGDYRAWNGRVYQAQAGSAAKTGTVPPIHDEGVEWDGMGTGKDANKMDAGGVAWLFCYNRYGTGRINAVADAQTATLAVDKRLASTAPQWRWAFGAFSARRGWPSAVTLWRERLVLAKDATLFGSAVGGYGGASANFAATDSSGDFQRDLAFKATLPNPDAIKWMAADRLLLVGTARAEHAIEQVDVQSGSAGPPVLNASVQSTFGSAGVKPAQLDGRVMFVQRAGRKLLELGYSIEGDRYEAPDVTLKAEHLGAPGFVDLAWQQEPERHLWAVRGDGSLAALVYARAQGVAGWARRALAFGLAARSACVIDAPDGREQQLWIAATMPEGRWVALRMAKMWETGDDPAGAQFLDAAISYAGPATASGGGATHLAGQTVSVLADGKPHRNIGIGADGSWAIDYPASTVTLGLPFQAIVDLLPIEAGGEGGTAQGKLKRVPEMTLRVLETQGLRIAVQGQEVTPVELRVPANAMDRAVPLTSGDVRVTTVGLTERKGTIRIERFQPTPATLLAVMPVVSTGER